MFRAPGRSGQLIMFLLTFAAGGLVFLTACSKGPSPEENSGQTPSPRNEHRSLVIFHAASLSLPLTALEKRFEERNPNVDVIRESSSSRLAIRKVTELNRNADIVASADEALLRDLMMPEYARWVAWFARNRIVIAYTNRSKHRSEITADNWPEILLRPGVAFGYCNPNMAPVGYRTLLAWKLADKLYGPVSGGEPISEKLRDACPESNIRPHCNELIPLLESLSLDYTFQYKSVALQHHLEWLKLPDAIDLGNEALNQTYAQVNVTITGESKAQTQRIPGKAIVYGLTIPTDCRNPEDAVRFLQLLLGDEGDELLTQHFQEPINPPLCVGHAAAPDALKPLLETTTP